MFSLRPPGHTASFPSVPFHQSQMSRPARPQEISGVVLGHPSQPETHTLPPKGARSRPSPYLYSLTTVERIFLHLCLHMRLLNPSWRGERLRSCLSYRRLSLHLHYQTQMTLSFRKRRLPGPLCVLTTGQSYPHPLLTTAMVHVLLGLLTCFL